MSPSHPPETPVPMRVRICSHITQTKFVHVEDSLGIGKLRLFAGTYRKGNGMDDHTSHFMDVDDARVVFNALAMAEPDFTYKEYKGTAQPGGQVTSRVLSVAIKGEQVYLELKAGPGKTTPTGAVTPNGRAKVEVNVAFKRYEARRLGRTVLAYLQAWDILRLMSHRNLLGKVAAYEWVPTAGQNGTGRKPATGRTQPIQPTATVLRPQKVLTSNKPMNEAPKPKVNGAASAAAAIPTLPASSHPPAISGQRPTRPLTRRGPAVPPIPPAVKSGAPIAAASPTSVTTSQKNGPVIEKPPLSPAPSATISQPDSPGQVSPQATAVAQAIYGADELPLRYGDATLVDGSNAAEVKAFQQYQAERGEEPPSRPRLREFMRQHSPDSG